MPLKDTFKNLAGWRGKDVEAASAAYSGNAATATPLDPFVGHYDLTTTGAGANDFSFVDSGNLMPGAMRAFSQSGVQDATVTFTSGQVLTLNTGETAVLLFVNATLGWILLGGTGAIA